MGSSTSLWPHLDVVIVMSAERCSRASLIQRIGRAGREPGKPAVCIVGTVGAGGEDGDDEDAGELEEAEEEAAAEPEDNFVRRPIHHLTQDLEPLQVSPYLQPFGLKCPSVEEISFTDRSGCASPYRSLRRLPCSLSALSRPLLASLY